MLTLIIHNPAIDYVMGIRYSWLHIAYTDDHSYNIPHGQVRTFVLPEYDDAALSPQDHY